MLKVTQSHTQSCLFILPGTDVLTPTRFHVPKRVKRPIPITQGLHHKVNQIYTQIELFKLSESLFHKQKFAV